LLEVTNYTRRRLLPVISSGLVYLYTSMQQASTIFKMKRRLDNLSQRWNGVIYLNSIARKIQAREIVLFLDAINYEDV
jgi:hypothetical protein